MYCIVFRYIRQIQSIQLAEQQDCFQSNKVIYKFNKVIYKFSITELTEGNYLSHFWAISWPNGHYNQVYSTDHCSSP
jgi:hypothetical protein